MRGAPGSDGVIATGKDETAPSGAFVSNGLQRSPTPPEGAKGFVGKPGIPIPSEMESQATDTVTGDQEYRGSDRTEPLHRNLLSFPHPFISIAKCPFTERGPAFNIR